MARTTVFLALSVLIFIGAIGTGWMYHEVSKTRGMLIAAQQSRTSGAPVDIAAYIEPAGGTKSGPISELPAEIIKKELIRSRERAKSSSRKFEHAKIELAGERRAREKAERELRNLQADLADERKALHATEGALSDVKTALAKQREETETAKLKIKMMTAALELERSARLKGRRAPENVASKPEEPSKPEEQGQTRELAEHALKPARADVSAIDDKQAVNPSLAASEPAGKAASDETAKKPLSLVSIVQIELKRVGCYQGKVDGVWNEDSRHALWKFVKYGKHNFSSPIPPKSAITALKAASGTVCP